VLWLVSSAFVCPGSFPSGRVCPVFFGCLCWLGVGPLLAVCALVCALLEGESCRAGVALLVLRLCGVWGSTLVFICAKWFDGGLPAGGLRVSPPLESVQGQRVFALVARWTS